MLVKKLLMTHQSPLDLGSIPMTIRSCCPSYMSSLMPPSLSTQPLLKMQIPRPARLSSSAIRWRPLCANLWRSWDGLITRRLGMWPMLSRWYLSSEWKSMGIIVKLGSGWWRLYLKGTSEILTKNSTQHVIFSKDVDEPGSPLCL